MELTDAERKRRSDRAKELVEQGKIGGPRPGSGRPRKVRAAEIVAEKARANADKIAQAYIDALDPAKPDAIRLQAARDWLGVENKEGELTRKEEKDLDSMNKNELVAEITKFLVDNQDVIDLPPGDYREEELGEHAA